MLESFIVGGQAVLNLQGILMMIMGIVIGIVFGAIPGLSATMAIALFLPITYSMSPIMGVTLLVSLFIGGISGGLISAILTRIPGTPSSIATTFDGYPLTQKGEGAKALGVGIVFSCLGTVFSTIVLIFLAPQIAKVSIKFGAYEYFSVAIFSLSMISGLSGDSLVKGIFAGIVGCIFATIGMDPIASVERYTFGFNDLKSGFNILPALIGLFAISEILFAAEKAKFAKETEVVKVDIKNIKGFGFSIKEFFEQKVNFIYASVIGTAIGILPGIGGGISNVLAYTFIRGKSKHPEKFGTGIIDGIVASEASNNASIGGALVPLLTLGIPGDTVTAMLLGGLTIHGISPGPLMFTQNVDIVYSIFITMMVGSILMLFIEFYGLRGFVALLKINKAYLLPAIFMFCAIGSIGLRNRMFDVWSIVLFGAMGYFFQKLKIPGSPFILGFILGPLVEINLRRGLMFSRGSFMPFLTSPISAVFLVATAVSISISAFKQYKAIQRRKNAMS